MQYHPAWERKGALAHAAVRMDLEDVMLMKHASLYKDKCWVISVPGGSQGKRTHRNRKESGDYQAFSGVLCFTGAELLPAKGKLAGEDGVAAAAPTGTYIVILSVLNCVLKDS